jgi:hypothetical protein
MPTTQELLWVASGTVNLAEDVERDTALTKYLL